jgi:hypothetical protein
LAARYDFSKDFVHFVASPVPIKGTSGQSLCSEIFRIRDARKSSPA